MSRGDSPPSAESSARAHPLSLQRISEDPLWEAKSVPAGLARSNLLKKGDPPLQARSCQGRRPRRLTHF